MNNFVCCNFSLNQFIPNEMENSLKNMKLEHFRFLPKMDLSFQETFICPNEASIIFNLIDRLRLIVSCIKQQNNNIKSLVKSDVKSLYNFEKIKLVDLIKLMIMSRNTINFHLNKLFSENSYLLREILTAILEFDQASYFCVDHPINDLEVTCGFRLSISSIDFIINDCGFDLSCLHKLLSANISNFDKKRNLMRYSKQCIYKTARFLAYCDKTLIWLYEVGQKMCCIGKILKRLISGNQCTINFKYFHSTEEEINEFSVEINVEQLQRIVNLKSFLLELESKLLEYILVIMEFSAMNDKVRNDDKNKYHRTQLLLQNFLSPIRKTLQTRESHSFQNPSFLSSTPAPKSSFVTSVNSFSVMPNSMENLGDLNDESLSSLDSGFLITPCSEQSIIDGYDNVDIIPFSEDEYEKIDEGDGAHRANEDDSDLCESITNRSEYLFNSSNHFTDRQTNIVINDHFNAKEYCRDNCYCHLNKNVEFLFRNKFDQQEYSFELRDWSYLDVSADKDSRLGTKFEEEKDGEEKTESKIMDFMEEKERESYFNAILGMAIYKIRQNDFGSEQEGLEYIENMWKSYSFYLKQEDSKEFKSKISVDTQFNNNACTSHQSLVLNAEINADKQNTNNNANSKDDESAEQNSTKSIELVNNDESIILDNGFQGAFQNMLIDSGSSEMGGFISKSDSRFTSYRDVCANDSTISSENEDWNDNSSGFEDQDQFDDKSSEHSVCIDDLELIVKLSELQLRSEFESDIHNQSIMVYDKNRILDNYKIVNSQLSNIFKNNDFSVNEGEPRPLNIEFEVNLEKYNSSVNNRAENRSQMINISEKSIIQDTSVDKTNVINERTDTEFSSSLIMECSLNIGQCSNNESVAEKDNFQTENYSTSSDMKTSDFYRRISHTVILTKKLLDLTQHQLNFMFTLFNKNSSVTKSTILRNKSLSVFALRKRLKMAIKILCNLRFATRRNFNTSTHNDDILNRINKLYDQSENLVRLSFDFEQWVKKNGWELEKIGCYNFEHELPNDLLIKMEPNDFEIVLSISTHRLQTTISALSHYPCYNYLMRLSLMKNIHLLSNQLALNHNIGNYLNEVDLLPKLCKLRRVTAICALNIVDLHVMLTKLSSESCLDKNVVEAKTKDLLIIWRAVDGECHRLLCCTSMVHHVLVKTKRSYIELVSMIVVMDSILRTIPMSNNISTTMKTHIYSLQNYQQRISSWLEEVEMCISIIYLKRMTNKRFKFYDDIHKYLNENISTISELANQIKKDFRQAVRVVNDIVDYCASLQNFSVVEIGKMLTRNALINNEAILPYENSFKNISEDIFRALIDLEEITIRLNRSISNDIYVKKTNLHSEDTRELLDRSQAIFEFVADKISNVNPVYISHSENVREKNKCLTIKNENLTILQNDILEDLSEILIAEEMFHIISSVTISNISLIFYECENQWVGRRNRQKSETDCCDVKITKFFDNVFDEIVSMITNITINEILAYKNDELEIVTEILLQEKIHDIIHRTVKYFEMQMDSCRKDMIDCFLDYRNPRGDVSCRSLYVPDNQENSEITGIDSRKLDHCQINLKKSIFAEEKAPSECYCNDDCSTFFTSSKLALVDVVNGNSELDQILVVSCACNSSLFSQNLSIHHSLTSSEYKSMEINEFFHVAKNQECCQSKSIKMKKFNRNNKISHLVAHFNQSSVDNLSMKKSPLAKLTLEQIFFNILNSQSNQMVEELASEVMKMLKINSAITSSIKMRNENVCFLSTQTMEKKSIQTASVQQQEHVSAAQDQLSFYDKPDRPQVNIPTCHTLCNRERGDKGNDSADDLKSFMMESSDTPRILPLVVTGNKFSLLSLNTESVDGVCCEILFDDVVTECRHACFEKDFSTDKSIIENVYHSANNLFIEYSETFNVDSFSSTDGHHHADVEKDSVVKPGELTLSKSMDSLVVLENPCNFSCDITCRQGNVIDKRSCSDGVIVESEPVVLHFGGNVSTKKKQFNSCEIHKKSHKTMTRDGGTSDVNEPESLETTLEQHLEDKNIKRQETAGDLSIVNKNFKMLLNAPNLKTGPRDQLYGECIMNREQCCDFIENNNVNNFLENVPIDPIKSPMVFDKKSMFFKIILILLLTIALLLLISPQSMSYICRCFRFRYSFQPQISTNGLPF